MGRCRAGFAFGLVAILPAWPLAVAAGGQPLSPASISLIPPCPVQDRDGTFPVTVAGANFHPFTAVLVTFDAGPGGRPESVAGRTDGFGRFTVDLRTGGGAAGGHVVRADDFRGRETTADLVLPCNPKLILSPLVGPPGFVTQATGTGFPAGATIRLSWSSGISGTPPVVADGDGGFRVPVLIFPKDMRGPRRLRAEPAAGSPPFPSAQAPFLVVRRTFTLPGERR